MKKKVLIVFAVIATLLIAWSVAWIYISSQIRANVEALALNDGVAAPRLACERIDVTGFPFRFDVACAGLDLRSGDLALAMPEIRASALAYRPNLIRLSLRGPAELTDAFTGTRQQARWNALEASLRMNGGALGRLSVHAEDLALLDMLGGETVLAAAGLTELHALDVPEKADPDSATRTLALFARVQDADAPGPGIAEGALEFSGELSAVPDNLYALVPETALARWQAAGGALEDANLYAEGAGVRLDATGGARLDEAGRPEGRFEIVSQGLAERLGDLVPENLRPLLLGLPQDDGSYRQQINLRAGAVLAGIVPVASVPPLF